MKKYYIGYTAGVFDMFHICQFNMIRQAKKNSEIILVGGNIYVFVSQ